MKTQYSDYSRDYVTLSYLRQDSYYYSVAKSFALTFYELLTQVQRVGQVSNVSTLALPRQYLNSYLPEGYDP